MCRLSQASATVRNTVKQGDTTSTYAYALESHTLLKLKGMTDGETINESFRMLYMFPIVVVQ